MSQVRWAIVSSARLTAARAPAYVTMAVVLAAAVLVRRDVADDGSDGAGATGPLGGA